MADDRKELIERLLDLALEATFPASDPVSIILPQGDEQP
jgi:hypothetical protein